MSDHQSPGEYVRSMMEAKGWTQTDLAFALGTTTSAVNQILSNKRGISANMARALGIALGEAPEKFARAQADWDVGNAESPADQVAARSRVLTKYPLREMIKRGWIDPEHGRGSVEEQVCRFFDIESIDSVPTVRHSAKKTDYDATMPASQLAWLFRVRQIASEMLVPMYSKQGLEAAIDVLREHRSDPSGVRYIPRLLNEAGVRFIIVESLPGSKIDGVCFWLNHNSPVIGLSLRFDRIDKFWFVLMHECIHVLHGHGQDAAIIDADLDMSTSSNDEELIANTEAAAFCVPPEKLRSFYLRKKPYFSNIEVMAFAKRVNVHPGLVVGQLQRMLNRYDLLHKHLVSIHDHLAKAMMLDGWGDTIPVNK